jgi:uncharacterized protein YjbI with pentapeptide repeats
VANSEHLALITQGAATWNQWCEKNTTQADLSEACLIGLTLTRVELLGADLSRIDLSRADLSESNLKSANLREAVLVGADLD